MPGGFPLGPELCNAVDIGTDLADSNGTGVTVACGNGVKGSWVQLIAATANDICALQVLMSGTANTTNNQAIDIGIGGAGSEVVLIPNLIQFSNNIPNSERTPILPIVIPAGTRIAARAQALNASESAFISIRTWDGSFTQMEGYAGVDAIGADLVNITGTAVAGSASAFTKSAYTQITAATARDYSGFFFNMLPSALSSGNNTYVDIAVGAGGSEVIIVPNHNFGAINVGAGGSRFGLPFFMPTPIPAGTRLAARFQTEAGSKTFACIIYGVYK
jgi:hypothetical protein